MVDIHSHVLPFVDDGSDSLSASIALLKEEEKNGVRKIILTPHNKASKEELFKSFEALKLEAQKQGLRLNLYLGQEVFVGSKFYERLKNGEYLTLNGTKHLLVEFNFFVETDIQSHVHNMIMLGYVPVIAHIERYNYLDWGILYDLKMMGALVQVNATCVLGMFGKTIQKTVLKAISQGLIDFVASDIHDKRFSYMHKAYKKVCRAVDKKTADKVFKLNAENNFNLI